MGDNQETCINVVLGAHQNWWQPHRRCLCELHHVLCVVPNMLQLVCAVAAACPLLVFAPHTPQLAPHTPQFAPLTHHRPRRAHHRPSPAGCCPAGGSSAGAPTVCAVRPPCRQGGGRHSCHHARHRRARGGCCCSHAGRGAQGGCPAAPPAAGAVCHRCGGQAPHHLLQQLERMCCDKLCLPLTACSVELVPFLSHAYCPV